MKPLILLTEIIDGLEDKILKQLESRFNVKLKSIDFELISKIPKIITEDGREEYSLYKYSNYQLITDYYPIQGDNVIFVSNIEDIDYIVEIIGGYYIKPKVWFSDELEWAKKMFNKLPDTFAWDTETMPSHTPEEIEQAKIDLLDNPRDIELTKIARSNGLMPHLNKVTMSSFSLDTERSFVLIHTPEIEEYIWDFLVNTEKRVICHNISFDMGILYHRTGKFIKNFEDTQLLAQACINSVTQKSYGLKTLAGHILGDWDNDKSSFDLYEDSEYYDNQDLVYRGSNLDYKLYNLPLIFYAGQDTIATLILYEKYTALYPEPVLVNIDNILPIQEPRDHEETPLYFYKNILLPIVTTMIELAQTPMPIDLDIIEEIKQEALDKREPAFEKLQNFGKVKSYMEKVKEQKIKEFIEPLILKNSQEPTKEYKHNVKDRTVLINYILGETREKWNISDLKKKIKELEDD